jgi:hypothetical protein
MDDNDKDNDQAMTIEIREAATRAEMKEWVRFPARLYANDPHFVPPLFRDELDYFDPLSNPAFEVCETRFLLAVRDGEIAGRTCVLVNKLETEKLGYRRGRFGWFHCVDDQAVADALLQDGETWCRELACREMTGPHGFGDLDPEGLLIEGFDALPTISGNYNAPYYQGLLERCGLEQDADYLEYRFAVPERVPFLERVTKRNASQPDGFRVLTCGSRRELRARIGGVWNILEAAFAPLYGVVPLTEAQTAFYTRKYFGMLDPDFVKLVYSPSDELVGFFIGMPNLSEAFRKARGRLLPTGLWHILRAMRRPVTVDFLLAGAMPGLPSGQLTAIGLAAMFETLRARGVRYVETNRELEENKTVNQLWSRFEILHRRRSRVYRKALD